MALLQPAGPAWGYCTTNLSGTPSNATNGTLITAGTSNANGTAVALLTALTHDVEYFVLGVSGTAVSAGTNRIQVDIMIDPAGGTTWDTTNLLIPDLIIGGAPNISQTAPYNRYFHFPVWVKSGASIGIRARTAHTVAPTATYIHATVYGGNKNPSSWWCGQKVEAIGTTTAASSGTSHTAGSSGAYSSWTNFGSTTTYDAGAVQWAVQTQLSTHGGRGYFFEFGAGSTIIGPNLAVTTSTGEQMTAQSQQGVYFCSIPSGTQLQVRGTCNNTAEALDVAAYIVS